MSEYGSGILIPKTYKNKIWDELQEGKLLSNYDKYRFIDLDNWILYPTDAYIEYADEKDYKKNIQTIHDLSCIGPIITFSQICDYNGFGISIFKDKHLLTQFTVHEKYSFLYYFVEQKLLEQGFDEGMAFEIPRICNTDEENYKLVPEETIYNHREKFMINFDPEYFNLFNLPADTLTQIKKLFTFDKNNKQEIRSILDNVWSANYGDWKEVDIFETFKEILGLEFSKLNVEEFVEGEGYRWYAPLF